MIKELFDWLSFVDKQADRCRAATAGSANIESLQRRYWQRGARH